MIWNILATSASQTNKKVKGILCRICIDNSQIWLLLPGSVTPERAERVNEEGWRSKNKIVNQINRIKMYFLFHCSYTNRLTPLLNPVDRCFIAEFGVNLTEMHTSSSAVASQLCVCVCGSSSTLVKHKPAAIYTFITQRAEWSLGERWESVM